MEEEYLKEEMQEIGYRKTETQKYAEFIESPIPEHLHEVHQGEHGMAQWNAEFWRGMDEFWSRMLQHLSFVNRSITCYLCGQAGHLQSECRQRRAQLKEEHSPTRPPFEVARSQQWQAGKDKKFKQPFQALSVSGGNGDYQQRQLRNFNGSRRNGIMGSEQKPLGRQLKNEIRTKWSPQEETKRLNERREREKFSHNYRNNNLKKSIPQVEEKRSCFEVKKSGFAAANDQKMKSKNKLDVNVKGNLRYKKNEDFKIMKGYSGAVKEKCLAANSKIVSEEKLEENFGLENKIDTDENCVDHKQIVEEIVISNVLGDGSCTVISGKETKSEVVETERQVNVSVNDVSVGQINLGKFLEVGKKGDAYETELNNERMLVDDMSFDLRESADVMKNSVDSKMVETLCVVEEFKSSKEEIVMNSGSDILMSKTVVEGTDEVIKDGTLELGEITITGDSSELLDVAEIVPEEVELCRECIGKEMVVEEYFGVAEVTEVVSEEAEVLKLEIVEAEIREKIVEVKVDVEVDVYGTNNEVNGDLKLNGEVKIKDALNAPENLPNQETLPAANGNPTVKKKLTEILSEENIVNPHLTELKSEDEIVSNTSVKTLAETHVHKCYGLEKANQDKNWKTWKRGPRTESVKRIYRVSGRKNIVDKYWIKSRPRVPFRMIFDRGHIKFEEFINDSYEGMKRVATLYWRGRSVLVDAC